VLGGRFDFLFPPEHQAIIADRIHDAHLEIIERAGHIAHAERAEEVIGIIRRFMTAHAVVRPHALSLA
jgi:pimeloyl-ACP methyl ester carboxylesterase